MAKYLHKQANLYNLSAKEQGLLWAILEQIKMIVWNDLLNDPDWRERYFFLIKKSYVFSSLRIFDFKERSRCKDLILDFTNKLPFSVKGEDNPKIIIRENLILDIDWDYNEEFFKLKLRPDAYLDYASWLIGKWKMTKN